MHHIEDLPWLLSSVYISLKLIVAFLVHVGKGHAASFVAVERLPSAHAFEISAAAEATVRNQNPLLNSLHLTLRRPKSALSAAIANARRNNPSLGFEK